MIEIQRTDADQPFHVAFTAKNGQTTFWCENLKTRATAKRALVKHVEQFLGGGTAMLSPELSVLLTYDPDGNEMSQIQYREVDLRGQADV